ncbi:protein PAXX isoform X1 [Grammomys surdaster]|uniref:protein PAXX isoform X1 n=1 Tax=Grammomys surdaster TaxID=491861 RepID=UPI00109FE65D|nr:protein PAXX isoform X1 [Grammomys surdaster]
MAPPPLSLPLCILPPGSGSPRLVCFCEPESGGDGDRNDFNLYVTDAAELWSTCFSPDSLVTLKARFGLSGAEDIHSRFRAACQQQAVTVSLQKDRALMTLVGDTSALAFDLSKVPSQEAAPRLQALTLSLAERVCNLERRLAAAEVTATSPMKNIQPAGTQFFLPGRIFQCGQSSLEFKISLILFSGRTRSPERQLWAWGQETVSRGVSHQPWLQK